MSSENAGFKRYPKGKTMSEPFIDEGQWFMLLRDAEEYASGSGFENALTEFIYQLKPTNVFPSSFDFELKLADFKTKF